MNRASPPSQFAPPPRSAALEVLLEQEGLVSRAGAWFLPKGRGGNVWNNSVSSVILYASCSPLGVQSRHPHSTSRHGPPNISHLLHVPRPQVKAGLAFASHVAKGSFGKVEEDAALDFLRSSIASLSFTASQHVYFTYFPSFPAEQLDSLCLADPTSSHNHHVLPCAHALGKDGRSVTKLGAS